MQWRDTGTIIHIKPHGETSVIIHAFTREHGRHAGLVRGGRSKRLRPVLQPGNLVDLRWNARLSEHLGVYQIEPLYSRAAMIMGDRLALSALNSMSALCMGALPERQAYPKLYDVFNIWLENLHDDHIWPALYVRFELSLLEALGYGLDLSQCAATGAKENLTHVSPRSGKAVSLAAAEPYLDKLLPLPAFLQGKLAVEKGDIEKGLALSGYFLEKRVFNANNTRLPEARTALVQLLSAA